MSGAPTIIGTSQFAKPTNAGMIAPKIMMSACMVVNWLNRCGSITCRPGWYSSARMSQGEETADEEHGQREPQVQRTDVLVIGGKHPSEQAGVRSVMVVVVGVGCVRGAHYPQPPVFKLRGRRNHRRLNHITRGVSECVALVRHDGCELDVAQLRAEGHHRSPGTPVHHQLQMGLHVTGRHPRFHEWTETRQRRRCRPFDDTSRRM